jgi:hypothetical protein
MRYRVYELKDFNFVGSPTELEAADDATAITIAQKFLNGSELQIWQGNRFVVTLKPEREESASAV